MTVKFKTSTKPSTSKAKEKEPEALGATTETLLDDIKAELGLMEPLLIKRRKLEQQLAEIDDSLTPHKKKVESWVEALEYPADQTIKIISGKVTHTETKVPMKRELGDKELIIESLNAVEDDLALKLAKFTLKDLGDYLTKPELEKVTITKPGKRTVKYTVS